MKISVHLQSILREGRFKAAEIDAPSGCTTGALIDLLGIPRSRIGIIVVNRADATFEQMLVQGDKVTLFPPLGGG